MITEKEIEKLAEGWLYSLEETNPQVLEKKYPLIPMEFGFKEGYKAALQNKEEPNKDDIIKEAKRLWKIPNKLEAVKLVMKLGYSLKDAKAYCEDNFDKVSDISAEDELHQDSEKLLKVCFEELRLKMIKSQKKYGWSNEWLTQDWEDECREQMIEHLQKGDPRDVAVYAMFMIYRGWTTNKKSLVNERKEYKLLEKDNDIIVAGKCANCGVEYHIHADAERKDNVGVNDAIEFAEWIRTFEMLEKKDGYWVLESQISSEELYKIFQECDI